MKKRILAAALVTSAFAAPAVAAPLDITNISGIWVNPVGGTSVTGENTSHITWGGGTTPSAYEFLAAADILAAAVNAPLLLGTFTHENNSIPIPNLSAVDLDLSFDTNGIPSPVGALFDFDHNETPNTSGGSPLDDDIVTIGTPIVNIPINVGGELFFFNLLGFSQDGGSTFDTVFTSPEGGGNSAALYGRVTREQVPVPEPASALLFGVGAACAVVRRRAGQIA